MIGTDGRERFAYFPVAIHPTGRAWVRVDLVAAITPWELILVGDQAVSIKLADDTEPEDVLAAMAATLAATDPR